MNAPYYLLRGGNLSGSSLNGAGSGGYYWASTPDSSNRTYYLGVGSGNAIVVIGYRYYGFPVRCVAAG